MQAGAFICSHNNLAAGYALRFRDGSEHSLAGFKRLFSVFLKQLARGGDRNLAAGAVEQLGPDFFLEGANLR